MSEATMIEFLYFLLFAMMIIFAPLIAAELASRSFLRDWRRYLDEHGTTSRFDRDFDTFLRSRR